MTDTVQSAPRQAARRPTGAALLLVVAAACLWGSSRMIWVTVVSSDGLTEPRTHKLDGGTWFGAMTPLALVLLAAVAAVYVTRGWLRRGVGIVVAVLAALAAVPWFAIVSGHSATADRAAKLAELPVRAHVDHVSTSAFPVWLSLAGALAAFAAGLLLARMPQGDPQLSGKYDNPVFRRADAAGQVAAAADSAVPEGDSALPERVLWDALDAGTDPTAGVEDAAEPDDPSAGTIGSGAPERRDPDPADRGDAS
ncbi:TIGR02234 family membrane protein [Nocardia stercoris]|uniref:TIGR02234 family membrane protein n=1 Tax=Nocardia stercoris TaxID=2483361 RepID=A0A3M2KZY5_9NOCA|nr:TIGR02234 family membrane protein [Nocardia stercoris]RMI29823.1 TIGR02234 family membrane protein [Nocardia stercoris]